MLAIPQRFPAPVSDQAMYLARSFHNAQGHLIVRLAGRLNAPRLARAVRLTLDAEPVLGCRFVAQPFRPYWQRRSVLDSLDLCPVFEGAGDDVYLWRFITTQLDGERDGVVRVGVFRGSADTLCLKLDHMVADASGVLDYARLLAAIYASLGRDSSYVPEPNLGSRSFGQAFRTVRPSELLSAIPRPAPDCSWNLKPESPDRGHGAYAITRMAPVEVSALTDYCRKAGVAMTNALLAAYFRALFALLEPRAGAQMHLAVPVDLRRALPGKRAAAICNLTGVAYPAVTYRPGASISQTLADVQTATIPLRSRLAGLDAVAYLKLLFVPGFAAPHYVIRHWGSAVPGATSLGLANIGVLDPEQIRFDEVAAYDLCPVGPISYSPGLVITTSTCGRCMTITAGYCHNGEGIHFVQRLVDAFRAGLLELAQFGGQQHGAISAQPARLEINDTMGIGLWGTGDRAGADARSAVQHGGDSPQQHSQYCEVRHKAGQHLDAESGTHVPEPEHL